jgi:hypothetical protein
MLVMNTYENELLYGVNRAASAKVLSYHNYVSKVVLVCFLSNLIVIQKLMIRLGLIVKSYSVNRNKQFHIQ